MNNKRTRAIASAMALSMSLGMLAACNSSDDTTGGGTTGGGTTGPTTTGGGTVEGLTFAGTYPTLDELKSVPDDLILTDFEAEPITLPIVTDGTTLSYFGMPNAYVLSKMTGFADMVIHQEAEARTGVAIEWREESYTDPSQKMNLMYSTGDTTDIVWDTHKYATGGAAKMMSEGLILPLNKYIEYYAPNFKALLMEYPDLLLECSTAEGFIYCFPQIRLNTANRANSGFMVRADWLERTGLDAPETVADWYEYLVTCQEMDMNGNGLKDEYFLSLNLKASQSILQLTSSYNFTFDFCLDGTEVIYGPATSNYYDYLVEMEKWYSEGLIDPEYSTIDSTQFMSKMLNDQGAGLAGNLAGHMGSFVSARYGDGTGFDLLGCVFPESIYDGNNYTSVGAYAQYVPHGATISASVGDNVITAVKWLDWHYSEEGVELYNWGLEGQAFEYDAEGNRYFTELITNNPDGLSKEEAGVRYAGNTLTENAGLDDLGVFYELRDTPQQQSAIATWSNCSVDLIMPELFFSDAEVTANSNIMSEIKTYAEEMINKFIMGVEPLNEESYQAYIDVVYGMGLQQVLDSYQSAYNIRMGL